MPLRANNKVDKSIGDVAWFDEELVYCRNALPGALFYGVPHVEAFRTG